MQRLCIKFADTKSSHLLKEERLAVEVQRLLSTGMTWSAVITAPPENPSTSVQVLEIGLGLQTTFFKGLGLISDVEAFLVYLVSVSVWDWTDSGFLIQAWRGTANTAMTR